MRRIAFVSLSLLITGLFLNAVAQPNADEIDAATVGAPPVVWVVDLDGPLGPASGDLVARSIEDAAEAGARAIVIRMDTPGGLDKTMRDLIQVILASQIPVITYVSPQGARAASAGTYIAYASHIAAMAPATNIGSSTPVSLGAPTPPMPSTPGSADENQPSTQPDSADAMTRKIVNDAVAYLQGLAELRGRNIEWAEETVRAGVNVRASEALERNIIDLIATDLLDLLDQIDGHEVTLNNGTVKLATSGARVHTVTSDWRHELLTVITDPTIAYALLLAGVYGLILEFYNPGVVVPAVVGVICLLLGAYGLQMLPVNYAGIALIIIGVGLMVAEAITPSFGILGFGGLVAFVSGSLILVDSDLPGYNLPLPIIAAFSVASAGVCILAAGAAIKATRQQVTTGIEGMIGAHAEVLEDFEIEGRVFAFGESWNARSKQPVKRSDSVRVTGVDGLTLIVEQGD
ncbi:MAG: nodulation protein NfeD [Proteobacteria bacterium]|nr:nodulation protein NfeD [Pseudomonadota bacterium]